MKSSRIVAAVGAFAVAIAPVAANTHAASKLSLASSRAHASSRASTPAPQSSRLSQAGGVVMALGIIAAGLGTYFALSNDDDQPDSN